MKRFHFRLARVERWRRQIERERRHEHAAASGAARSAEASLLDHERTSERLLEEEAAARASGRISIEEWTSGETQRLAREQTRSALAAAHAKAQREAEQTLESLVAARTDLRVVESLEQARRARWRRESEIELQKQADEAHRARLGREGPGGMPGAERHTREGETR